jgi:hypothetical protein
LVRIKADKALDEAEDPRDLLYYSSTQQVELLQKVRRGVADHQPGKVYGPLLTGLLGPGTWLAVRFGTGTAWTVHVVAVWAVGFYGGWIAAGIGRGACRVGARIPARHGTERHNAEAGPARRNRPGHRARAQGGCRAG